MALTEVAAQPHGRHGRRGPFSALMKKFASLKAGTSGDGGRHASSKWNSTKKRQNNPYPQSGRIGFSTSPRQSNYSVSSGPSRRLTSISSLERNCSVRGSSDGHPPLTTGARSMAPTISTEHETCRSIAAPSHMESLAGTSRTAGRRGGDSTFSSPAPSIRSLTTTLTTIQTATPNPNGASHNHTAHHHHHSSLHSSQAIHFSQPFPTASPASAIPPYLATSTGHPSTYATATANNLLTDDASILTLASSSRRRRRRSLDTDASIRAVAPSSLWGGSRESLPLSVLSANFDGTGSPATPGIHRSGAAGMSGAERASIYSATGIMSTAAASERNSFYAKQGLDAASVRSGLLGHNRTDSVNGSIVGLAPPTGQVTGASPLASPREVEKEGEEEEDEEEEKVAEEREKRKWKGKEKMKEKMKGKKTV